MGSVGGGMTTGRRLDASCENKDMVRRKKECTMSFVVPMQTIHKESEENKSEIRKATHDIRQSFFVRCPGATGVSNSDCSLPSQMPTELPYAADAELSLTYDELDVLRIQYQKELAQDHVTIQTKFNYAWGLVKSPVHEHQVEGVRLLQGRLPTSRPYILVYLGFQQTYIVQNQRGDESVFIILPWDITRWAISRRRGSLMVRFLLSTAFPKFMYLSSSTP